MTQPTRATLMRLCPAWTVGLAAVAGLLLGAYVLAAASAAPGQPADTRAPWPALRVSGPEQLTATWVLWLAPPSASSTSGPWALVAEARQAGWQRQEALVGRRLAALQARGQISGFESLPVGSSILVTAPLGLPAEVHSWPEVVRCSRPDAATPEALADWWQRGLDTLRPASLGALQASTLTLNLGLHSLLVSGATPWPGAIALSLVRITETVASATATPFPDGHGAFLYVATLSSQTPGISSPGCSHCPLIVEAGDVLQAVQAGHVVSLTVPTLTALAARDTQMAYGQALPSTPLQVYYTRYSDGSTTYQQTITTTAAGDYQADLSAWAPIVPHDYGHVIVLYPTGDSVYRRYNVPFLQVEVEGLNAEGLVAPCTGYTATLLAEGGSVGYVTSGYSSEDGTFTLWANTIHRAGSTLVVTAAGQVVSMVIPSLTVVPNAPSDTISGQAPAGAPLQVDVYAGPMEYGTYPSPGSPSGEPDHRLTLTATQGGTFAADFSGLADIVAGDYGLVYMTTAYGYGAYRLFAVPFLQARLGEYRLVGQVNGSTPLTVTVWGSSGVPRNVRRTGTSDTGLFCDEDGMRLLAGDWVTVTAADGQETGLQVPLLTAEADPVHSTIHGQAPANSRLRVGLSRAWLYPHGGCSPYYPRFEYTVWVTSTSSGVYTADLSALTRLTPGYVGSVFAVNPDGYEVHVEFTVPAAAFVRVHSGGNEVSGLVAPHQGNLVMVTLLDASGRVKASEYAWTDWQFEVSLYQDGQPAIIRAGDTVQVDVTGASVTVTVPVLTVQIDRVAGTIWGQAPPVAPLQIARSNDDRWAEPPQSWVVTSTAAGSYVIDLHGQVNLERGDHIAVTWSDENGNEVWVAGRIPRLQATLGEHSVSVLGPAYSPLTVTVRDGDGRLLYAWSGVMSKYEEQWIDVFESHASEYLRAGQTIVAELPGEAMTLMLPYLTARADPQTHQVSGEAPPGARLMVLVGYDPKWYPYLPVTATVTGTYCADLSGQTYFGVYSVGQVEYLHPGGHRVTLKYAVPHLEVTLGQAHVSGLIPRPGTVTLTLYSATGIRKGGGTYNLTSLWFGVDLLDAGRRRVAVDSGDLLVVETVGSVMTWTVPVVTASFDRPTSILRGAAPPGAWLEVQLNDRFRHAQAGPDGRYAMDWGDLSPRSGWPGQVTHVDDRGNRTSALFVVPYYVHYLPLAWK